MTLQKLFSRAKNWTKYHSAISANNQVVNVDSRKAVAFCLLGGLVRCYTPGAYQNIVRMIQCHLGINSISNWNDAPKRTFKDIKKLIKDLNI